MIKQYSCKIRFSENDIKELPIIVDSYQQSDVCYNNLKSADWTVSFNIPFDVTVANKIKEHVNDRVIACIYDENNKLVHGGYIKDGVNFSKTQANEPISISISSPYSFIAGKADKTYVMVDKKINYIIAKVITLQIKELDVDQSTYSYYNGLHEEMDITAAEKNRVIPYFEIKEGDNYKDLLQNFLYEYGWAYTSDITIDNRLCISIYDIFETPADTSLITRVFDGSNIRNSVQVSTKASSKGGVRAKWTAQIRYNGITLFDDTSKHESYAGRWFPNENNETWNELKCDSSIGKVLYIYNCKSSVLAGSKWKSQYLYNKAKEDGFDGHILGPYNISIYDADESRLTSTVRFKAHFKESLASYAGYQGSYISRILIEGDALIEDGAKSGTEVTTTLSNKEAEEVELKYVHNQEWARYFATSLANYYRYSNFTISLSSKTDYPLGSFVKVTENGIGTFYGRIREKKTSVSSDTISYTIDNYIDFEPATIEYSKTQLNAIKNSVSLQEPDEPSFDISVVGDRFYFSYSFDYPEVEWNQLLNVKWYLSTDVGVNYSFLTTEPTWLINHNVYGYPDSATISTWKIRALLTNKQGKELQIDDIPVSLTNYQRWTPNAGYLSLKAVADYNGDSLNLSWNYDTTCYGTPDFVVTVIDEKGNSISSDVIETNSYKYYFDRDKNGYPEKSDLAQYTIRITQSNESRKNAYKDFTGNLIDTDKYGTWLLSTPIVKAKAIGRTVSIMAEQPESNLHTYGYCKYKVYIKKGNENYFCPDLTKDVYSDLNAYKNEEGDYLTFTSSYTQKLPLDGQDNELPVDTAYTYKIVPYNVITERDFNYVEVTVLAECTGAADIATSAITSNKLSDGCVTYEKLHADIVTGQKGIFKTIVGAEGVLGKISGNTIFANSNNKWDLEQGTFRVGSENQYIEYNPETGKVNIAADLDIDADFANIRGELAVYPVKTKDTPALRVLPDENNAEWNKIEMRGKVKSYNNTIFGNSTYGVDTILDDLGIDNSIIETIKVDVRRI